MAAFTGHCFAPQVHQSLLSTSMRSGEGGVLCLSVVASLHVCLCVNVCILLLMSMCVCANVVCVSVLMLCVSVCVCAYVCCLLDV